MTGEQAQEPLIPLPPVERALQINLYAFDAFHAEFTVPHQLRVWADQVDRVLVTVDTGPVGASRYQKPGFADALDKLLADLKALETAHPKMVVDPVRYDDAAVQLAARTFFPDLGCARYPLAAFDGGPFHVYFYGLARCNARFVLHMDGDMLFGGGSTTWMDEAIARLSQHHDALVAAPLSGPPTNAGDIDASRHSEFRGVSGIEGVGPVPLPQRLSSEPLLWSFATVSTRVFLLDMQRFCERVRSLRMLRPPLTRRLRALLLDQDPTAMPAEAVLTHNMVRLGLGRLELLGEEPGLFSIHPWDRTPAFIAALPAIIRRIEENDIPEGQRGDFDLGSAMFEGSPPRRTTPLRRAGRGLKLVVSANRRRFARR